MKTVLVTGSAGLIGSESVEFFDSRGWRVVGVDNNLRREFFGPDGDTSWNLQRVRSVARRYVHHTFDIRDWRAVEDRVRDDQPNLIIHCAAQPSHDLALSRPFDDFQVNANGTLNLLEAVRRHAPESPFVFMSTNKVYGDSPNELPLVEMATRFDYASAGLTDGIDENCRIDASLHSLFGASKLAADVLVQEYGRYFGMPTVCFRAGCVTGPNHSGAELHGFLAYLAKAVTEGRTYRIFGYQGKQVRDNIHSIDVCRATHAFYENPSVAAVYNLGGGRANSLSVLEAIDRFEELSGCTLKTEYHEQNRKGDLICYITCCKRFKNDYPGWQVSRDLDSILLELVNGKSLERIA